jgi:hypothetical protein
VLSLGNGTAQLKQLGGFLGAEDALDTVRNTECAHCILAGKNRYHQRAFHARGLGAWACVAGCIRLQITNRNRLFPLDSQSRHALSDRDKLHRV